MATELVKCPECDQFIPAERLDEHVRFHKKYGTGKHAQKRGRNRKKSLKEKSRKYKARSHKAAAPRNKRTLNSDQKPSKQASRIKSEKVEYGEKIPDNNTKTITIDGKIYVDRTIRAPVPPEIRKILEHSKKREKSRKIKQTSAVIKPSMPVEPVEPVEPVLSSLENFQDFLLYAAEKRLKKREFDMLCQRFGLLDGEGRTLWEVGQLHDLSRERIRQLIHKSMRKIVSIGLRQLKNKKYKAPCAMAVAYVQDVICHGQEDDTDRFIEFAEEELPHLTISEAVYLLGYFFGGRSGIKMYRRRLSRQLAEIDKEKREQKRTAQFAELLDDVIWPQHMAKVYLKELRTWKPQREISSDSIGKNGHWHSKKMGRHIGYESELERKFIERLDTYENVIFFLEQPLKIPYVANGKAHTYYPDILMVLDDGLGIVVEIKPSQGMATRRNWVKWSAMRAYCNQSGYGFLVTDGRKSIQQLTKQEVRPEVRRQLLDALSLGPLDWRQYKDLRKRCLIKTSELYALVIQEKLNWRPRPFHLEKIYAL